jgi:hypothetical protein
MALGTIERPTGRKPGKAPNPGDEEYEENFEKLPTSSRVSAEEAEATKDATYAGSVADNETGAEPPSIPYSQGGGAGNPKVGGGSKIKAKVIAWVVTAIFGIFGVGFGGMLVGSSLHLTQAAMKDSKYSKYMEAFFSTRQQKIQNSIFTVKTCIRSPILCRMTRGISPEQVKFLQEGGALPTDPNKLRDALKVDAEGHTYVDHLIWKDGNGEPIKVHYGAEFNSLYETDPVFRERVKMGNLTAIKTRSAWTMKLWANKWKIKFKNAFPKDDVDPKKLRQDFIDDHFGTGKVTDPNVVVDQGQKAEVDRLSEEAKTGNHSLVDLAAANGSATDVASKALSSGFIKRLGGQAVNLVGNGCFLGDTMRKATSAAWLLKSVEMARYAAKYFNVLDSIRAGEGSAAHLGFMLGLLFLYDGFGNSNFVQHFVLGQPMHRSAKLDQVAITEPGSSSLIWNVVRTFLRPFNKTTCSAGAQIAVLTASVLLAYSTGSLSAVLKLVATSVPFAMAMGLLGLVVDPLLLHMLANASIPGVDADGELKGEGLTVGAFRLLESSGLAMGLDTATSSTAYESILAVQPELARMEAVNHLHTSPFSLDDIHSIPNQLAWSAVPYLTSPFSSNTLQNLASMVISPFSLVASSANSVLMQKTKADSFSDTFKDVCPHDIYAEKHLASTGCNNLLLVLTPQEQAMDPQEAIDYMVSHDEVDAASGRPKKDSTLQKYLSTCMDAPTIFPDNGGPTFDSSLDTSVCDPSTGFYQSRADEMAHIHVYIVDTILDESTQTQLNGTLGTTTASNLDSQ